MSKPKYDSNTTVYDFKRYESSGGENEFGPFGAGDSRLILNVGEEELMKNALKELQNEIPWSNMKNRGILFVLKFFKNLFQVYIEWRKEMKNSP